MSDFRFSRSDIFARLAQLGINVVSDKHAATTKEVVRMVGVNDAKDVVVPGSKQFACTYCKGPVFFSPAAQQTMADRERESPGLTELVCLSCVSKITQN